MSSPLGPDLITAALGLPGADFTPIDLGHSEAEVWRLRWNDGGQAYLKAQSLAEQHSLSIDRDVQTWLTGRYPVPEVLAYQVYEGWEYLLMRALPGQPACEENFRPDAKIWIKLLAEGLKQLHALPIQTCPFDRRLKRQLTEARLRLDQNLVEVDDFEDEYLGMDPEVLYQQLLAQQPADEDLVFCHGDACLPNYLLERVRSEQYHLSGLIDLGRAGIADRWQDLALLVRSLGENGYGPELQAYALECYGIQDQPERREYYVLLDEFF